MNPRMTYLTKTFVAVASLILSYGAYADAECRLDGQTRSVNVVYSNPGQPVPCEVLYEKPAEGQSMTLWRADNEAGFCEARAAEFIKKLEGLGWRCNHGAEDAAATTSASD